MISREKPAGVKPCASVYESSRAYCSGDCRWLPDPEQAAGLALKLLDLPQRQRLRIGKLMQAVADLALDAFERLLAPADLLLLLAELFLEARHVAVLQKIRDLQQRHIQRAQIPDGIEHLKLPGAVIPVAGVGVDILRRQQAAFS